MNRRGMRNGGVVAALATGALITGSVPALALDLSSEQTWGGPSIAGPVEQAEGVAVASDGSVYLVGQTSSFGTGVADGNSDIFLLKYAPDGTLAWQRTYGVDQTVGTGNEFGMDVDVAPDGTVWITGELAASVLLAQFDPGGNLLSERTFAGVDSPRAIDIANDGSIYVTGFEFPGAGQGDAFVMKAAPDGTLVWLKTWGAADGFDAGIDVAAASDGSVYVAGDTNGFGANGAFLVKFDADGNVTWERTYDVGTQNFASGQGVAIGPDGSVYLTGSATVFGVGMNALLVKFAPDGSLIWERTWQQKDASEASGIAVAANGDVYITGRAVVFRTDDTDAFVAQFEPDGRVHRAATWGGVDLQIGQAVALAPDGSVRVAGGTSGPPPYSFDNASKREGTPVSVIGTPTGVITTPDGTATDPNGIVLTPNGSQTYAGGSDAVLLTITP